MIRCLGRQSRTFSVLHRQFWLVAAGCSLVLSLVGLPLIAAPINHGNFMGTTVTYLQVTEDALTPGDTPPLYGVPTVAGDSLDFNPVGFSASDSGGGVPDVTDGQLQFDVEVKDKNTQGIFNIKFQEFGDTTLAGLGTDNTRTIVTSDIFIDVIELNGLPIDPVKIQTAQAFSPHGGQYLLGTHGGGGPNYHTQWMGMALVDLQAAIINAGHPANSRITKITVNLDNTLTALSEVNTSALIAKKDHFIITTNIPEPASFGLAAMAMIVGGCLVRRRSW